MNDQSLIADVITQRSKIDAKEVEEAPMRPDLSAHHTNSAWRNGYCTKRKKLMLSLPLPGG